MEPSDLLNIEQQSFTLSENVKKLINNRTENLTRLREQRKNCYTEMKAFRNDLNKFLDKIEDEFFNELSMLEREQIDKIQSVVWELGNITKAVENVKMQLKEIKNCASSKDMNESKLNTLQQIKRSLSENELNVYTKCNTLTDGSGWKEIDLNMSPDPALQIVTSKIKSLGEVFITTCPVSIALDGKKPVVEDIEMTEENLPENEDKEKEKEKEGNFLLVLSSFMYPFFPHNLVSVVVCLFASCFFISSSLHQKQVMYHLNMLNLHMACHCHAYVDRLLKYGKKKNVAKTKYFFVFMDTFDGPKTV